MKKNLAPEAPQEVVMMTGRNFGKMTFSKLVAAEHKANDDYNKAVEKEKAAYDKYLTAMCVRATKMERLCDAQRELELHKQRIGIRHGV